MEQDPQGKSHTTELADIQDVSGQCSLTCGLIFFFFYEVDLMTLVGDAYGWHFRLGITES